MLWRRRISCSRAEATIFVDDVEASEMPNGLGKDFNDRSRLRR